jgi:hypothetical protein
MLSILFCSQFCRALFNGTGTRVWKPSDCESHKKNTLRVTSNLLELEILPATEPWQDEQLRAAIRVLDRTDDESKEIRALRRESLRRLRYLNTEAATRELARRYPGRDDEAESTSITCWAFGANRSSSASGPDPRANSRAPARRINTVSRRTTIGT